MAVQSRSDIDIKFSTRRGLRTSDGKIGREYAIATDIDGGRDGGKAVLTEEELEKRQRVQDSELQRQLMPEFSLNYCSFPTYCASVWSCDMSVHP
jgi:hypothetical protein